MVAVSLVLSIFPGLGLLDRGFEAVGFCVVRGPDPIWGGDVRDFSPPAGVFDGVIGGDPCQSHSALSNLVRAKGLEPTFPDLTDEFARIVWLTQPRWFLRENVPMAPGLTVEGYGMHTFILRNEALDSGDGMGEPQKRKRRFWFGVRGAPPVDLRRWIPGCVFELPEARTVTHEGGGAWHDNRNRVKVPAVTHRNEPVPVKIGGSGKVKRSAVTGRNPGEIGTRGGHRGSPGRYTIADMLELQGLPPDFLDHCPFTATGKRKAIGNGVPQSMARALARAVVLSGCGER